jgi:hypothetical protein
MNQPAQPVLPADWVQQLQSGALPVDDARVLDELRRLAADVDPADSLAVFANVDVPEIDEPESPTAE